MGVFISFCIVLGASAYPTLNSAYTALGFDPNALGNSVVVHFSDPHFCLQLDAGLSPVATTNLDPQLVNILNAMQPSPAKIIVSGDLTSTYSVVPGYIPNGDWYIALGTNEMNLWWPAIAAITNIAPENILWCPGNHDQDPREANADMICQILGRPPHAAFDVNGIRFLLLNGGNHANPSPVESAWFRQETALLSPTQTVAVVVHQPPFNGITSDRGIGQLLNDVFKDWQARWYVLSGHAHCQDMRVVNIGRSNVAMMVSGSTSTNVFNGLSYHPGFRFFCLSNGLVGTIYYHLNSRDFEVEPQPDWSHPTKYLVAFEDTPGLLWRRLKTGAVSPEVLEAGYGADSVEWYAYTYKLQWRLNLNWHSNQATHFLLLGNGFHAISKIDFSLDQTNWTNSPFPTPTNDVYAFPLPLECRTNSIVYVRFTSDWSANNFIGGWGLATTNNTIAKVTYPQLAPISSQTILAGRILLVTNIALSPYAPPDQLEFTLLDGPVGSAINPTNGIFSWQPTIAAAPQTVMATVQVADFGTPIMSATQQVQITVLRPVPPQLTVFPQQDGHWGLQIFGDTGINYTIWNSTNLQHWLPVATTNPAVTPFGLALPSSNQPQEFFRVSIGP